MVESQVELENKLAFVTYKLTEGKPHILDSIVYDSGDPYIDSLINAHHDQKLLTVGENYDQDNLIRERERIETLLQDNGYYAFSRQYIKYSVDTTIGDHKVFVRMLINKPITGKNMIQGANEKNSGPWMAVSLKSISFSQLRKINL